MCEKCDERHAKTQKLAMNIARAAIASAMDKKASEVSFKDGDTFAITDEQRAMVMSALSGAFVGTGKLLDIDAGSMLFGALMQLAEVYPEVRGSISKSLTDMKEEANEGFGFLGNHRPNKNEIN